MTIVDSGNPKWELAKVFTENPKLVTQENS